MSRSGGAANRPGTAPPPLAILIFSRHTDREVTMRKLLALLAAALPVVAQAQDSLVSTEQVSQQRLVSRTGGHYAETVQIGSGNTAETNQAGSGNRAVIRQDGIGNVATIRQSGYGLNAESAQVGTTPGVAITQSTGAGSIRVQQYGPGTNGR